MIQPKKVLEQLSPYQQGKQTEEIKKEYGLSKVIKLASNENPYGASPEIKKGLMHVIEDTHIYPDGYVTDLRTVVVEKYNIKENNVVFGSGSDELIQLITRAFLVRGDHTVMATPTFSQYKHNATIEQAYIEEVALIDGVHDLDGMLRAMHDQTKIVWICNPNNPTGTVVKKDDFVAFMDQCPKDVLVILDEAYYEFMDKNNDLDAIPLIHTYPNLLILRTLSKAYGLAGLRVAYGIGDSEVIKQLDIVRGPFNTSALAQKAASIALQDEEFLNEGVETNQSVRKSFEAFLDSIGWKYFPSETNFLLVSTPVSGTKIFDFFIKNGFIVRPGELLGYPHTVRISIGRKDEMDALKKVIEQFEIELNKGI